MKKSVKVLSVVLSFLMIASVLPLSVFAAVIIPPAEICTEHIGAATCVSKAECELCGLEYGEIDPNAHEYDDDYDSVCNLCKAERDILVSPPITLHEYSDKCDATCNVCGYERVAPHNYDHGCDAECNDCGNIREPKAHRYYGDCDATCNVCGYERPEVGAHTYQDLMDNICDKCGFVREIVQSPDICIEHVYSSSNDLFCNNCNALRSTTVATDLGFRSASLVLESSLTIRFRVEASLLENGYSNAFVAFKFRGKTTVVEPEKDENGYYFFDFKGVAPDKMTDTVYATLYAKNGSKYYQSATRDYSVQIYCEEMLNFYGQYENDTSEAIVRTTIVDLVNYGAKAQVYSRYKERALITDLVNEKLITSYPNWKKWGTQTDPTLNSDFSTSGDTTELAFSNVALFLGDAVVTRIKVKTDSIEDLQVKIANDWTFDSDDFYKISDSEYYLYFDGLNADQMREVFQIIAFRGGEQIGEQVTYSIVSYAYSVLKSYEEGKITDSKLVDLVKAMITYGDSVNNYVSLLK